MTINNKGIPILPKNAPAEARDIVLSDVMRMDTVCLTTICTVKEVTEALKQGRAGYPVLNTAGRLVGLIPTHMLVTLIHKRSFYDKELIYQINSDNSQRISDVSHHADINHLNNEIKSKTEPAEIKEESPAIDEILYTDPASPDDMPLSSGRNMLRSSRWSNNNRMPVYDRPITFTVNQN